MGPSDTTGFNLKTKNPSVCEAPDGVSENEKMAILPEYKHKFAQISENVSISGAIITIQIFLQTEFISPIYFSQQKHFYL